MKSRKRNGALDVLRFFSALAIVYFHMALPGSEYALSALPVFVLLSVTFGYGKPLGERAARLLIPWAFWCAVYFAMKLADIAVTGSTFAEEFHYWMILSGPAIHLWYLPFMFLFFLFAAQIPNRLLLPVLSIVSVLSYLAFVSHELGPPFSQWASVIPAASVGVAMKISKFPRAIGITAFAVFTAVYVATHESLALQNTIALALVIGFFMLPFGASALTGKLSNLSFGIYLTHPIFASIAHKLHPDVGYLTYAFVVAASIIATILLQKRLSFSV